MNTADLDPAAVSLRKGEIHRLRHATGQRVEALSGSLWVTIDNDVRDILVSPGRGFTIDRDGDTLVSALADARFVVLQPDVLRRAA
ncbi:MAG TPA: DUF2917 domain-containing protein [Burkholderiaceae bacterium]|nr:DUF2917 domain-containing protein [Burkholderiaceae bacterium]